MKVAYLGWGSLVWDPRDLQFRSEWFSDGPLLPLEFARESRDRRITVVITSGSPFVRSLWTLSSLGSVESARANLAAREGIADEKVACSIGVWQGTSQNKSEVDLEIGSWASRLNLDAVVWTNLKARFDGQHRLASADEIVGHMRKLSHEQRAAAERYVRKAPRQIDTPYRRQLELALGWTAVG